MFPLNWRNRDNYFFFFLFTIFCLCFLTRMVTKQHNKLCSMLRCLFSHPQLKNNSSVAPSVFLWRLHTLWIIFMGNAVLDPRLGFSHLIHCWLNPASTEVKSKTPIDFTASRFWLFRNAQPYVFSFWKYHVVAFGPCRVLVTPKEHSELQPVLTCPCDCEIWGPWGGFEGQNFCCCPVFLCVLFCFVLFSSQISLKYSKTQWK